MPAFHRNPPSVVLWSFETALAPRRRNDRGLDEVTEHAVVAGRLVVLVQKPDRHQEQADVAERAIVEASLDVCLLDLDLARIVGRRHGVLDLELAHEPVLSSKR